MSTSAWAQSTAFTYQGRLFDNNTRPIGNYDFSFRLLDANSNAVAGPVTNSPVGVTNGLFIVTLDFGSAVFDGSDRRLEIRVRHYGETNAFVVLSPPQPFTATPYAIHALTADNALTAQTNSQNFASTNTAQQIATAVLPLINATTATNIINGQLVANGVVMGFPEVTVSPSGLANGLSKTKNNGMMFGPDTPGTATGGLQEAINCLLANGTNIYGPIGGRVVIGPGTVMMTAPAGVFQRHSDVFNPPGTNFNIIIQGAGQSASGILYVGTTNTDVLNFLGLNGGIGSAYLRDLFISSTRDMPNYLVKLFFPAKGEIANCWLGYWPIMIAGYGGGFTPPSIGGSQAALLCGVKIDGGGTDDILNIHDNDFLGLAGGVMDDCDHLTIDNNMFLYCGNRSGYTNTGSPNQIAMECSKLSFGGAIIFGSPNPHVNAQMHGNYFYGGNYAYIVDVSNGGINGLVSYGDGFEAQSFNTLISPQSRLTQYNPHGSSGAIPGSRVFNSSWEAGGAVYAIQADDPNKYIGTVLLNAQNAVLSGFNSLTISGTLNVADGSGISKLQSSRLVGAIPVASLPVNIPSANLTGQIPDGLISATFLKINGNGSGLTGLTASQISDGLTTNLPVLVPGGGTRTLQFINGVLKGAL